MSQTTTKKEETTTGIDSYKDFESAIMEIHSRSPHDPHVVVSDRLFQALANGRATNYLTYGSPGVKVYKTGTKQVIDAEEAMGLTEFHELEIKRKRGEVK